MQLTTELVAELLDPTRQPVVGAALEVEALQGVPPVGIKTCIGQTADLRVCKQESETCLCVSMLATSEHRPTAPLSIKLTAAQSSMLPVACRGAKHCMHVLLHVHVPLSV